jgi:hypothetical protein
MEKDMKMEELEIEKRKKEEKMKEEIKKRDEENREMKEEIKKIKEEKKNEMKKLNNEIERRDEEIKKLKEENKGLKEDKFKRDEETKVSLHHLKGKKITDGDEKNYLYFIFFFSFLFRNCQSSTSRKILVVWKHFEFQS